MKNICSGILSVANHIKQALNNNLPVVALESTIISHGMPYPQNKQCALQIQSKIRQHNAMPATIAILDGKIKVGLSSQEIQRLAYEGSQGNVRKVSRRDIPYIIMNKSLGATTVSSTMISAHMAGIDVFVTGGIGGVHRGFEHTMDVSADLRQLGKTPITVVSAGVKSILDIPRTLQYLQTEGVPVVTYKSKYFPAFFSASSGLQSPLSLNSVQQIANLIYEKQRLNLQNGILIAVPNNNPAQGQQIQKGINQALKESIQQNILGAKITPFLLKRVNELTKGKSLKSNISLVNNNAEIGAKIAFALSKKKQQTRKMLSGKMFHINNPQKKQTASSSILNSSSKSAKKQPKVIVIGASAIDTQYRPINGQKFQLYKSCQGISTKRLGGCSRNIAQTSARLGTNTVLITALGKDFQSNLIIDHCKSLNIDLRYKPNQKFNTAQYVTVLDQKNDELIAISEMEVNNSLNFDYVYDNFFRDQLQQNKFNPQDIIVIDANFNHNDNDLSELQKLLQYCNQMGYFVIFQCKGKKTSKIAKNQLYKYISMLRMNKREQQQFFSNFKQCEQKQQYSWLSKNIFSKRLSQKKRTEEYYTNVRSIITDGFNNQIVVQQGGRIIQVPIAKTQNVIKTTGAGDTLTGTLCSMLTKGKSVLQCLKYGNLASKMTIQSTPKQSVISTQISLQNLQKVLNRK